MKPYPWNQPHITWGYNTTITKTGNDEFQVGNSITANGNLTGTYNSLGDHDNGVLRGMSDGSPTFNCGLNSDKKSRANNVRCAMLNAIDNAQPKKGFDMGTSWGEATQSKVVEVTFEKGVLTSTFEIYYASRESLIEMGVPITNDKQVAFPIAFSDSKYATPPKGWNG